MHIRYPSPTDRYFEISRELRKYEELEIEIKQLSGFNLDCLKQLFAMGYTLQSPKYKKEELTMANAKQCDICKAFYPAHKLSRRARGFDCRDSAAIILFDPNPDAKDLEEMNEGKIELETCPTCMSSIRSYIKAMTVDV